MIKCLFFIIYCSIVFVQSVYYDTYKGIKISKEEYASHLKQNTTFWCTVDVKLPCSAHEWRRVDGSCNNLQHPPRGAVHTPTYRLLPAYFRDVDDPRPAKSGKPLPLSRFVRTSLIPQGRVPDQSLSQLVSYFSVWIGADVGSFQDSLNYILWKPHCCKPEGRTDRECTPNQIPHDDPVHRFSGVRCMNLTRPFTFQSRGCLDNSTTPVRILTNTPAFDLSRIYGLSESTLAESRQFKGGLLKQEIESGRIWPPSTKDKIQNSCQLNQKPRETRCHQMPDDGNNSLLGQNLLGIWLWRYHNKVAEQLIKINPCWDDDILFYIAREVNIAVYLQILYYEFMPLLLGYDNLIRDDVISPNPGYRDIYNDKKVPQTSLEFLQIMRWFHTVQDGTVKMYDTEGHYLKKDAIVNLTIRTGYLAVDDNIDYITQGSFRQRSAKIDNLVDPDLAEYVFGPVQDNNDVLSSDLAKNRYFGLAPYTKYREFCFGKKYDEFDDLIDAMDEERIEILKEIYQHIEDIDLMAGIWSENKVNGGFAPQTFYCIFVELMLRNVETDRHWYERQDRPHAFTLPQLREIRKATFSRLLCDVGDKVTRIQPGAFQRPKAGNEIISCKSIPEIDFSVWRDPTCYAKTSHINKKTQL